MSRFDSNNSRRTIHIPEIGSYAVLNEFIKNEKILSELTDFIDSYSLSFSKIIMEDGSITKHDQVYNGTASSEEKNSSHYIDNIVKKIIKSAGAKKVLKLDIANCYSSIYTHFLPAILLGYEFAEENYKDSLRGEPTDHIYDVYSKLDKVIRKQNSNQTNGLLVGPLFSKIVVEALLTRIDIELSNEEIVFSRYLDDYEVYLYGNDEECVVNIFISVLKKYGLSLNFEKTQLVDFPYYVVENFDRIIEKYRENTNEDYDLIHLFNVFLNLEKSGTKGAVRYLLKSIEKNPINFENKDLFDSYILSILTNDDRSLTKACSLVIAGNTHKPLDEQYVCERIKKMLKINIEKKHDLEVIWLLYVLIETDNINSGNSIITDIINSQNELAKIMILRKRLVEDTNLLVSEEKATSWILNYELYVENLISEDEFFRRLPIKNNREMYEALKEKEVHFCY